MTGVSPVQQSRVVCSQSKPDTAKPRSLLLKRESKQPLVNLDEFGRSRLPLLIRRKP